MSKQVILAIGAHPDDVEYGCGGTILKHISENDIVYLLFLTAGEQGEESKSITLRKKEAEESAKMLGVKELIFGNLKDTKITHSIEVINVIENVINRVSPDIIYTHHTKDTHQDHTAASASTLSAARNVRTILMYEGPSSTHRFKPQYFVSIDKFFEQKMEIIRLHASQQKKRYMDIEALRGLAMFRGYEARSKYAEAFEVFRIVD